MIDNPIIDFEYYCIDCGGECDCLTYSRFVFDMEYLFICKECYSTQYYKNPDDKANKILKQMRT